MSRLPFNPASMTGVPRPGPDDPLSVTSLSLRIEGALRTGIPEAVRVVGEVSGFSDRTHWYFSLKDANAVVQCVMFASAAKKTGFTPAHGQQVVARGRVEFYAPSGKVSFVVEKLEPVGEGARELALRRLVEEIRALGWLAPERKRALPTFPRRIAVITSAGGAALQDVLVTLKRRCPAIGVLVCDVRVQGEKAAAEVAGMIRRVSREAGKLGVDAIVVTRGGGSAEDLWAFNDRELARAIVESRVPVVAAIGHETDTSIAELVADERCATPTQAAMRLSPDSTALLRELASLESRLRGVAQRRVRDDAGRLANAGAALERAPAARLARLTSRLDQLSLRLSRRSPAAWYAESRQRVVAAERALARAMSVSLRGRDVAPLSERLARAAGTRVRALDASLAAWQRALEGVNPLRVLERGYSVTLKADGTAVRAPEDVSPGEALDTRLAMGTIRSLVEGSRMMPLRPKKTRDDPKQHGLF